MARTEWQRKRRRGDSALPTPPAAARAIMHRIVGKLETMERQNCSSPLDQPFRSMFAEVVVLVERFKHAVVDRSGLTVTCTRGCVDCCCHWVEDVNSFEAAIIADFLKTRMPDRIEAILHACRADCLEIEELERLVTLKLEEQAPAGDAMPIDPVDLLLSVFYQRRRPCPLLSPDGSCSIYEVRPLTCRMYVSFSDPLRCNPDYINSSVVPTCLIDLSEAANRILDTLHFRFLQFDGDTGLRSLLVKYLSGGRI